MKIIYVTNEYPDITSNYGGIAVVVKNEVEGFIRKGYTVEVILLVQNRLKDVNLPSFIKPFYWPVQGAMKGIRVRLKLISFLNTNYLKEDIVVCTDYAGLIPFIIKSKKIVQLHNSLTTTLSIQGKKVSALTFLLEYFTIISSDRIRAVSKSVLLNTYQYFPFSKYRPAEVIFNGVNVSKEDNIENNIEQLFGKPGKNIVFIGKLSRLKGVDFLSEIINRVHLKLPEANFTLIGHNEFIDGVSQKENLLNQVTNKKKIVTYDRVDNVKINELIRNSQLLILPSRTEALPMVVIEAFANARPVVVFNVGGLSEMIDEGMNGFLITPFDVDLFSKRIIEILTDNNLYQKLSVNAKNKFKQTFQFDTTIEKLEKFYLN